MTTTTDAPEWVSEHGDGWAPNYEVLRTLAGSNVHGLSVGTDDRDEMGVYVEAVDGLLEVWTRMAWMEQQQWRAARATTGAG